MTDIKRQVDGSMASDNLMPEQALPKPESADRFSSSPIGQGAVFEAAVFNKVLDWEQGLLSETDTLALFQLLVDRHWVGFFSGAVRRTAALLIRDGQIHT